MLGMSLLSIEGEAASSLVGNGLGASPLYVLEHQSRRWRKGGREHLRLVQLSLAYSSSFSFSLSLSPSLEFSIAPPSGPGSIVPHPHCSILQTIPFFLVIRG